MPTNNWRHILNIADLIDTLEQGGDGFTTARDELVSRIRSASFHDPHDIVLRSLIADLAAAR